MNFNLSEDQKKSLGLQTQDQVDKSIEKLSTKLNKRAELELLDDFAAHALQGLLSSQSIQGMQPFNTLQPHQQANISYTIANAMIEERKNYIK